MRGGGGARQADRAAAGLACRARARPNPAHTGPALRPALDSSEVEFIWHEEVLEAWVTPLDAWNGWWNSVHILNVAGPRLEVPTVKRLEGCTEREKKVNYNLAAIVEQKTSCCLPTTVDRLACMHAPATSRRLPPQTVTPHARTNHCKRMLHCPILTDILGDEGQEDLAEVVNKLVVDVTTHEEALGNAAESFGEMKDKMKILREQMIDLMAMNQSLPDTMTALQVERPAKYNGNWDSRVIDNFLFQVEYYLDLQGVVGDDLQVKTAAMLLEGDAVACVQVICAHLNEGEGLRLTGESLPRRAVRSCRPVISDNLGKRLESRCRSSRRLAAIEESAMASNYNLRSASGKEPARPEEASSSHDQGNLEETVNRLVADVATHEEALGFAAETFEGFKEEMKLMREQMAESVAMSRLLSDLVKTLQDENVVEEDLKIKTAAMLLEGDAVAWWRRKMLDIENGDCTIRTFDDFRKQLKGYFMPVDAERHAYRLVANLKQTGALRDYIRAYQKVMLDVPMMPEKDKFHWFIIGLQSWAQTDVKRSNPETLEQAYVAAERLADTQRKTYTDTFKATKKSDHGGKRDDRRDHNRNEQVFQKPTERKTFFRKDYTGLPRDPTCWWVDDDQPTWEYAFRFKRSHPEEVRIYHEAASAEDGA
ncbi:hypothetical protein EJ110_NYTH50681 [Nymphaea thermarum]|nr:hypothetical protein EJ110_NYTH50681 [Nymphaea thermarum]